MFVGDISYGLLLKILSDFLNSFSPRSLGFNNILLQLHWQSTRVLPFFMDLLYTLLSLKKACTLGHTYPGSMVLFPLLEPHVVYAQLKSSFKNYIYLCVCVCAQTPMHVPWHVCRSQRTTCFNLHLLLFFKYMVSREGIQMVRFGNKYFKLLWQLPDSDYFLLI